MRAFAVDGSTIERSPETLDWDAGRVEKGGYRHFMLKEIFEQPQTIRDSFRGRTLPESGDVKLGGIQLTDGELRNIRRIVILACGTSRHAAQVGAYLLEQLAGTLGLPAELVERVRREELRQAVRAQQQMLGRQLALDLP